MTNPKAQTEILMNDLLCFAEKMLESHHEFHPFGGYLDKKEEVVHVGLDDKTRWTSDIHRASILTASFRQMAQERRSLAFGIATNVFVDKGERKKSAIHIFLEHVSGYCADLFFHYKIVDGKDLSITEVFAQEGTPRLF